MKCKGERVFCKREKNSGLEEIMSISEKVDIIYGIYNGGCKRMSNFYLRRL